MKSKRYLILIIIFCVSTIYFGCSNMEEDFNEKSYNNPIKIGFLGPFSAHRSPTESEYLGLYLAAEEINKTGGILGQEIQIIARDDAGTAEIGVKEAEKLHNEGIKIIIGPDWSSVTLAVARQVTIPKKMLLMSFSSTNPDISNLIDNDLVWRTCPSDAFQGKIGAIYCKNFLYKQTAGIIAQNNPYTLELAKTFQQNFINLGGTITHFEIYPELMASEAAKYDYSNHLNALFNNQPEVIYMASYPDDGSKITNDIAKNEYLSESYNPILFSNDGLYSSHFLENGYIDIVNKFIGTAPGTAKTELNYNRYLTNYQALWGFEPAEYTQYAYDALYLLAYAILSNNGVADPIQIATYLRKLSGSESNTLSTTINVNEYSKARDIIMAGGDIDYNGASGAIEFDANGDLGSGSYLIWSVKNGKFYNDTTVTFP